MLTTHQFDLKKGLDNHLWWGLRIGGFNFFRSLPILSCAKWSLYGEHFGYINHWSTLEFWDSMSAMSIYFRLISSVFATSMNIK